MPADKSNKAFCVLPWIEDYKDIQGDKNFFCCQSGPTDNNEQELRERLWRGEKIKQCNNCYTLETNKVISPRLEANARWMKTPEISEYFNTDSCPSPKIYSYELRSSNKCNLACICCTPVFSSLWEKELGVDTGNKPTTIDLPTLNSAKRLYLSGGEPLIIEHYQEIFDYIVEHDLDLELVINTNLSSVSSRTFEKLSKIRNCLLNISIDSYGKVNEYHRYPLSWDKFINNLDTVKESNIKRRFNTVADAVSVFGFDKLLDLVDYTTMWDFNILRTPSSLLLENIPTHLKSIATDKVSALKDSKFYKSDVVFKTKVNAILEQISRPGDSFLLSNYIQQLDARRKINHEDYLGIKLT